MFAGFSDDRVTLPDGPTLRVRAAGEGPAVLLLHGYPQTHACWHAVAPRLVSAGFRVVLSDLRGYGGSDRPPSDAGHASYSKRAMAADQVALMAQLGHRRFAVAGHDRGGRVAHRLARDWPDRLTAVSVLDIAPTELMYRTAGTEFATAYWHWFFLIQPAPLPERMIAADPEGFLRGRIAAWSRAGAAAFDPAAMAAYVAAFDAAAIHATCEDYRASAGIDLEHDRADLGRRLAVPFQALWGGPGVVGRLYDVPAIWSEHFETVEGRALPCGHFLPEEAPEETAAELIGFLTRHAA